MTAFEKLSSTQKIRVAIQRDVRAICSETCHFLGLEITKPAMEIIAELVFKKLPVYATDIEAFSKHAKRNVINAEDVKLLVRRNSSLKAHLNKIVPTTNSKEKRRKTVPKQTDTSTKPNDDTVSTGDQKQEADATKTTTEKENLDDNIEDFENMVVDAIDLTFD